MLVDCNLEAAEETKSIIDKEGGDCIAFKADVSKSDDCRSMVEKCIQAFGRIDILDHNVGIHAPGGPVELDEEKWDTLMNVNLKSIFLCCKYVLPYMEKQGNGSIINISSTNAIKSVAAAPSIAYVTSKAGVIAMTREIAIRYASKGIRANSILPGLMNTPWFVKASGGTTLGGNIEEMIKRRDGMSPTGKQGDAWDIAYAALFLASDEAKYINATTLIIDGGFTAQ
jgi:NAD(P)-dependent dehydrogenase (short-subunit alcohol dehydrogenase family)